MFQEIHLGAIALPFGFVVFVVATAVALYAGYRIGRQTGLPVLPRLSLILLVGLIAARVLFVVQHHDVYLDAPLSMIDITDGGWKATSGIGLAWLFGLWMTRNTPALRKPVFFAVAVFSILCLLGMALMMLPV